MKLSSVTVEEVVASERSSQNRPNLRDLTIIGHRLQRTQAKGHSQVASVATGLIGPAAARPEHGHCRHQASGDYDP